MFYQTQTARRPQKGPKNAVFALATLTFKLVRARDETRLLCEFGTNPFSGSRDISYTNKEPQSGCVKNRTFNSSLCEVTITAMLRRVREIQRVLF